MHRIGAWARRIVMRSVVRPWRRWTYAGFSGAAVSARMWPPPKNRR
jgi:hypothetical protein